KARQRAPAARPRASLENGQLESVAGYEHRARRAPGSRVRQLRELVVDRRFLSVLTPEDHGAAVIQSRRPGAAGGPRQVRESDPARALEVETVDSGGRRRSPARPPNVGAG